MDMEKDGKGETELSKEKESSISLASSMPEGPPLIGYVAYPFAGEAPEFDPNIKRTPKETKDLAPVLAFNDYATHVGDTVLQPKVDEFNKIQEDRRSRVRLKLKRINYLAVIRKGGDVLEKDMETRFKKAGMPFPKDQKKKINTLSRIEKKGVIENAGTATYLRSRGDDDPTLKGLSFFHQKRKKKEQEKFVQLRKRTEFLTYHLTSRAEHLHKLYVDRREKLEALMSDQTLYNDSNHNDVIDRINALFATEFNVDLSRVDPKASIKARAATALANATTQEAKEKVLEKYTQYLRKYVPKNNQEAVLSDQYNSIESLNQFFIDNFDITPDVEKTQDATIALNAATTPAERRAVLDKHLKSLLEKDPYGDEIDAISRACVQELYEQAFGVSEKFSKSLRSFYLSNGAQCMRGESIGDQKGPFILRQPFGDENELRIEANGQVFLTTGLGDARHTIPINAENVSEIDRYFHKHILDSIFGAKVGNNNRDFDRISNATFESVFADRATRTVLRDKVEAVVEKPFKKAVDAALKGVVNYHGTGLFWNAAHYGQQFEVNYRWLFHKLVIKKARRGELFISGPCGFQQEIGLESEGVIIAMQSLTGRTGLISEHLNDPYTVNERDTFASVENYTETAGITEKPVSKFEDGTNAWELRDVEPLFVEVASPRQLALNMDGATYQDNEGNTFNEPEERRCVPIMFQGKPVVASGHHNWTREDNAVGNEITYRHPLRKPMLGTDNNPILDFGPDGTQAIPRFQEDYLRDDLGNPVLDEDGNRVTEREKIVITKTKQTVMVKKLVTEGTPPDETQEFQEISEEIEVPEITRIERWVRVPLPDGKGSFQTKEKGKRMLCTYQKVVQTGGKDDPINPDILVDRIYIPLSCVHTQGVFSVGYVPLRPNTKITAHAIHPNDVIYGFTTLPGATLSNTNPHPIYYPPNTWSQTGMAEAIEIAQGNRTTGRSNQYHTDMDMYEAGKKVPIKTTNKSKLRQWLFKQSNNKSKLRQWLFKQSNNKSKLRQWLFKQSKHYFGGWDPDWAGRYTERVEPQFEGNREGLVPAMQTGVYMKETRGGLLDASEQHETGGMLDQLEKEVASTIDQETGENNPEVRYSPVLKKDIEHLINDFRNSRSPLAKAAFTGELKKRLLFDWVNEIDTADLEVVNKLKPAYEKTLSSLKQLGSMHSVDTKPIERILSSAASSLNGQFNTVAKGNGTEGIMRNIAAQLQILMDIKNNLTSEALSDIPPSPERDAVERDLSVVIRIVGNWVNAPDFLDKQMERRQEYTKKAAEEGTVLHDDTSHDNNARPEVAVTDKSDFGEKFRIYSDRSEATLEASAKKAEERAKERQRIDRALADAVPPQPTVTPDIERETNPLTCFETMLAAKRASDNDALRRAAEDLVHTQLFSFLSDDEKANHAQAWIALVSSPDFDELNRSINQAAQHEANITALDQQLGTQADRLKTMAVEASTQRRFFRPRGKNGWIPIALGWKASAAADLLLTTTLGAFGGAGAAAATATAGAAFSVLLIAMGVEQSVGAVYTAARVNTLKKTWEKYAHKLGREEANLKQVSAAIATVANPSAQQVLTQDIVNSTLGTVEKNRLHVKARVGVLKHNRDTQILHAASGSVLTAIGATGFVASIATITSKIAAAVGAEKVAAGAAALGGTVGVAGGAAVAGFGALNMALAARRWYRRRALRKEYIYNGRPRDYTLTKTFNKIEQARRKSYRFDQFTYGAMTVGGILLATGPATKGVSAIPGGILVATSVGAAYIAPRREWRGRNVRGGENTSHINHDYLTSESRKNRCLRTLNAEAGAMDNALSRIVQHKIDGDNEYSTPMDKQFRYKLQQKRWMRWLVNDYENKLVSEELARKFDQTKDAQFDAMLQITEHEHSYLSVVKKEQQDELDAIKERIALLQKTANGEPYGEHEHISMSVLEQQREKAEHDLQRTTEQYDAMTDLEKRLKKFEPYKDTKLDGIRLEQFNKLRLRFLVAHDLIVDVMTRKEARGLIQKQQEEKGSYITARIGGKDYPGSQDEVKGKVRNVKFDYSNDKTFDFLMAHVDRLDSRFAEMMCFSFREKTSYEVNTVADVWEEELLKASKRNGLREALKNGLKTVTRINAKKVGKTEEAAPATAKYQSSSQAIQVPDQDMPVEFKSAFKTFHSQLDIPFTQKARNEYYVQYKAATTPDPSSGDTAAQKPSEWFQQKIKERKAKEAMEKTKLAATVLAPKKVKAKRKIF